MGHGETGTHDDDAELDGTRWDCGMLSMGRLGLRRALRPIVKGYDQEDQRGK
jgi:hypothetical protein